MSSYFPQDISPNRLFRLTWPIIALDVAHMLAGALDCIALENLKDKSIPGHCPDLAPFFQWGTLPNVVLGFFMLILPQPVIWKLQVSVQAKIGLILTTLTRSVYPPTLSCCDYKGLILGLEVQTHPSWDVSRSPNKAPLRMDLDIGSATARLSIPGSKCLEGAYRPSCGGN